MKMLYERPSAEVINLQALENIAVIHDPDEKSVQTAAENPWDGSMSIGGRD